MTCKDCIHYEKCLDDETLILANACYHYDDRSRFVELPFVADKGSTPLDKIAHVFHPCASGAAQCSRDMINGFRVIYHEERLYTVKKDDIISLVYAMSPYDAVEKVIKKAEQALKERESNAE